MKSKLVLLFLCVPLLAVWAADPFADQVVSFNPGEGAGFGQDSFPQNVLGPPYGSEDPHNPQTSSLHLLSLGDGGSIILKFSDNVLVDEEGADLAIFENALLEQGADPQYSFCEAAIVAASQDGINFIWFPYDFIPHSPLGKMSNYIGFAGIHPTYSNPTNGISPIDPEVSGGDFFDLADTGLAWAQYVMIKDTGYPDTATETLDHDNDKVDDPGNAFTDPAIEKLGFDLDAIAAIHSVPHASASSWHLYP